MLFVKLLVFCSVVESTNIISVNLLHHYFFLHLPSSMLLQIIASISRLIYALLFAHCL